MSNKKEEKEIELEKETVIHNSNVVAKTVSLADLENKESEYDKKLTDKFSTKYIS